jgi:hypothetical protein
VTQVSKFEGMRVPIYSVTTTRRTDASLNEAVNEYRERAVSAA